jgi:periplasmic divalent cation tolerance protein
VTATSNILIVLCTCPDESVAGRLAAGLVEKHLAACVNVMPQIRSIYRWDGDIQKDDESLMVVKTTTDAFSAVSDWLQGNHPYDVPEILALPVCAGSTDYMNWVLDETKTD